VDLTGVMDGRYYPRMAFRIHLLWHPMEFSYPFSLNIDITENTCIIKQVKDTIILL
jgi:hypothetical protein